MKDYFKCQREAYTSVRKYVDSLRGSAEGFCFSRALRETGLEHRHLRTALRQIVKEGSLRPVIGDQYFFVDKA